MVLTPRTTGTPRLAILWTPVLPVGGYTAGLPAFAMPCTEDSDCTTVSFQETACEPGWPVPNGCVLFKGECTPHLSKCWSMHFKFAKTV